MFSREEALDRREAAPEITIEWLQQPQPESDSPIHTIHVLDHDSEVLLFLFDFLSNEGYQLSASSNVTDALEHVARSHPELLIADGDISDWTGSELVMRVRVLAPSTRVILTSARPDRAEKELPGAGGFEVMVKPIQPTALLDAVHRLLPG
jgi:two-component system, NtrC family, response regulator HydG